MDEDEVILRIPSNKSLLEAEKIIAKKLTWILRKQKEYNEKRSQVLKPTFLDGTQLPYMGKSYEIQIISNSNAEDESIRLVDNKFTAILGLYDYDNNVKKIRYLYEDWLYHRAKDIFGQKISYFSKVIGVYPKKLVVKKLRNRWGSATKTGVINLNYNLLKTPEDVIDYIIIHELCHLIVTSHSHHF